MADTSSKPVVQVRGKFGQVSQVTLDSNRPSLHGEAVWRSSNMVALSTRGIYSDALLWILSPAVGVRFIELAITLGLPAYAGLITTVFLLAPVLLLIFLAATQGGLRFASLYRTVLIILGLVLAYL